MNALSVSEKFGHFICGLIVKFELSQEAEIRPKPLSFISYGMENPKSGYRTTDRSGRTGGKQKVFRF